MAKSGSFGGFLVGVRAARFTQHIESANFRAGRKLEVGRCSKLDQAHQITSRGLLTTNCFNVVEQRELYTEGVL